MKFLESLSLILIIIIFGFFSVKTTFASDLTLSGSVKDSSGNGVVGATVIINDTNPYSTTTDSFGNYYLSLPSGTYNVEVNPPAGSNFSSATAFNQNLSSDRILNFILTPAGTSIFSGHIYDASGINALPNQQVSLYKSSNNTLIQETNTDSNGWFSLQVISDTYKIVISTNSNPLTVKAPQMYELTTTNYLLNQNVNLNISLPVKAVTVSVVDPANNPVSGVQIQTSPITTINSNLSIGNGMTARGVSSYGFNTTGPLTGSDGKAILYLLPTDASHTYSFTAIPPNGNNYVSTTASNISVTSNMEKTINLQQPVTFAGHVYDASGDNALPNQHLTLYKQSTNTLIAEIDTDSNGSYSMQMAPDTYKIVISTNSNPLNVNAPQSYKLTTTNYSLTQNVNLSIILPVKAVTVSVVDPANNPVSGVQIQTSPITTINSNLSIGSGMTASGASWYGSVTPVPVTGSDGKATLYLLPTDSTHRYSITAVAPSGSSYVTTTSSNIAITNNTNLTINMQKKEIFAGRIYDASGVNALPNQHITLYKSSTNSLVAETNTDSNGSFSMQVASDTYNVVFSVNNNPFSINAPQNYQLTVDNYALTQDVNIDIILPVKAVTVQIQDQNNNPVNGVQIKTLPVTAVNSSLIIGGLNASGASAYGLNADGPYTGLDGKVVLYLFSTDLTHTYTFIATPPNGSIYETFTLNDITITSDPIQTELISLQYAHETPVTNINLSPDPGPDNQYTDPVTVTLTSTAAAGYTIASTYYKIDGGEQQTYTEQFTISGNSEHTITYWSVDNSGVQESPKTKTFTISSKYSLSGTVYVDINQNGFQDTGESGYSGATISLDSGQATTTDENGNYVIGNLPANTYTETLTLPEGYTATTTNPTTVALSANTTQNFGIAAIPTATPTPIPNQPPRVIVTSSKTTVDEGESFTGAGSFTDADSESWTATVDYGDGSGIQPLSLNEDKTFTLQHIYAANGTYQITVKVTDNQGATGTTQATVTVVIPDPVTTTFTSSADTYVKSGSDNRNTGAGAFMRLRSGGDNRSLVRFDQTALQTEIGNKEVLAAKLRVTIVDNGNNWGTTGRMIDAHRLLSNWTEGNGTENNRGTGLGATWECATDSNITNHSKNCSGSDVWEMGQPNNPAVHPWVQTSTDTETITNNQSGVVEFDVTSDVSSFLNNTNQNYGWIIKKTAEGQNGQVSFGTKESASVPQLIVTYQP